MELSRFDRKVRSRRDFPFYGVLVFFVTPGACLPLGRAGVSRWVKEPIIMIGFIQVKKESFNTRINLRV